MSGRGILAVVVLAAWGAGLAAFMQREAARSPRERLAEAAMRVSPGALYFQVDRGRTHAGFASVTVDTIPDGLQITNYSVLDGDSGRAVRRVTSRLSRGLWLRGVEVAPSPAGAPTSTARVLNDSTLEIVAVGADRSDTTRQRFTAPLLVPALVPLAVALGSRPEAGQTFAYDVFDPARHAVRRLAGHIRAESVFVVVDSAAYDPVSRRWLGAHADTVRGWHVIETGGELNVWVDELGQVIRATDGGTDHRRTAYELAFENWRSAGRNAATAAPESLTVASIAGRATGVAPRVVDRLRVSVAGLDIGRLDLTTAWQSVVGDTVTVVRPEVPRTPSGYWAPSSRSIRQTFARQLQVEPSIEMDHPTIVAVSRRIRGRDGDPLTIARRLTAWVADSVRLEATLSPPSALATLRSRAGDVDHHATLFVALARASGIPARTVTGLIVRDGHALSHAWAEAYVGQVWLPVDPSLGEFPADASHLRLEIGGIGLRLEIDRLVRRSAFRVLDAATAVADSSSRSTHD